MAASSEKIRPYWHVDLKWIFGIFSTIFLVVSLLLWTLSNLTSEKVAIPFATLIVASQFSRDGLDDPKDIEAAKERYLASGQDVFYPLGNENVKITREELETLSPRQLRLRIFRQVVEPYYYEGVEAVANRTTSDPDEREKIKREASLLGLINKDTHEKMHRFFIFSLIPLAASFAGLIYFSYRYGRLISPAVVLLLVSTLPSVLLYIIRHSKGGDGPLPPFIPQEIGFEFFSIVSTPFNILFFSGIALVLSTVILKIANKYRQR